MQAMPPRTRGATARRLPWSSACQEVRHRWTPLLILLGALLAAAAFSLAAVKPAEGHAKGSARIMVENRTTHALPVELQGNGSKQSKSDILPAGACRMYRLDCPARQTAVWLRQPAGSWTAKCLLESGYHYVIEGPGMVRQIGAIGQ